MRKTPLAYAAWLLPVAMLVMVVACSGDPQQAAQRFVKSGDDYIAEEKLPEAVIQYRNATQQDPLSFEAHDKLGDALVQVGDLGNASLEYVRAADLKSEDPDTHVKAGGSLLVVARTDDARDRAERALAVDPDHFPAQLLLAQALTGLGDLDEAVAAAERAINLEPDSSGPHVALGLLRLQLGQREAAFEALSRAIDVDAESTGPRLALARFHWVTGDLDAAEVTFQAAVNLHPEDLVANRELAGFYVGTNRLQDAESYLQAVAEIAETPQAQLMLADYYARTERPGQAAALLEPLAQDPQNSMTSAQANVHLAAIDYEAGRTADAHERLSTVIEQSTNVPALLLSAELLLKEARYEEALGRAAEARGADPGQVRAHILIGRIQAQHGDLTDAITAYQEALALQPGNPLVARELGRLHLRSGNADSAVRFAQEAVAARPSDVEAMLVLSGGLLADSQYDRAAELLKTLSASHPRLAPVRVQEGILATRQGRQADARTSFELALEFDPENVAALNGLLTLDLAAGDASGARGRANEWLGARPNDPSSLLLSARVHAASDDPEAAERLLRRVLEVDPTNMSAYAELGQLYWRQDRLDDARREFDALAERSPEPAAAVTMAGILLQAQGRTGEAQERFERAIELDPEAAVAANNLAWIYAESGENLDRALSLAQRATSILPEMAETHDTLGWVHYKRSLGDLAVQFFEKSIALAPSNALYHYHLGLASVETGDTERARQALARALELQTDFQGADEARRVLAGLPATRL